MDCLTDGMLRAQLDGELSDPELRSIEQHCASCERCRLQAQAIAQGAERVRSALSALSPVDGATPLDARAALARFRAQREALQKQPPSLAAKLLGSSLSPTGMSVAVACVVLATLLSFAPARSWAQRLVNMLRVQRITAIPMDFEALGNSSDHARMGKAFAQMFSDDVVVTQRAGEPRAVQTPEEATAAAGFKVRLLGNGDPVQLKVLGEQAFHATIDRDRLQAILEEGGRSDLKLPHSLDGATFAAYVPKIVLADYGDCARRRKEGSRAEGVGETRCIELVQAPSPTLTVPPELNLTEVAEVGLRFLGMSPEAARDFSRSVDWGSTMVLGIPQGTAYRTVQVDGVQGTLIERAARGQRSQRYWLLWVKNGIIYSLSGSGDSADALTLAESLI